MMTWRMINGGGRKVRVWILPNGWLVNTSGGVYPFEQFFPGVSSLAQDTGVEFPENDAGVRGFRVGAVYKGENRVLTYRGTASPVVVEQGSPPSSGAGTMVLVGSGPYSFNRDVQLRIGQSGWERNYLGGDFWAALNYDLGPARGGAILPVDIVFPAHLSPDWYPSPPSRGNLFTSSGQGG